MFLLAKGKQSPIWAFTTAIGTILGFLVLGVVIWGIGILIAGLFLAYPLLIRYSRRRYNIDEGWNEHMLVPVEDGWQLAMYVYLPEKATKRHPVLLCHGLAANHTCFDLDSHYSLARQLVRSGYYVYSFDLRGCGRSLGKGGFNFDSLLSDVPAMVEAVQRDYAYRRSLSNRSKLHWVGHSMGAMLAYTYFARKNKQASSKIKSLVSLSGPTTMKDMNHPVIVEKLRIEKHAYKIDTKFAAQLFAPLAGIISTRYDHFLYNKFALPKQNLRRYLAHGCERIEPGVGSQLADWIREGKMESHDKTVSYEKPCRKIKVPTLMMTGVRDNLCPPDNLRYGYQQLKLRENQKKIEILSSSNEYRYDYCHGSILMGHGGPNEVFPQVVAWVNKFDGGR